MKRTISVGLIVLNTIMFFGVCDVFGDQKWAPVADEELRKQEADDRSPIWLRFNASLARYYLGETVWGEEALTMFGVGIEVSYRVYSNQDSSPKRYFALDLPFVFTVHQEWFVQLDDFIVAAQLFPTVRHVVETKSGLNIAFYFGFGIGMSLQPDMSSDNKLTRIVSLRLGADLMFSEKAGISLGFTKSWIPFEGGYWAGQSGWRELNKSIGFNQFGLAIIIHP